MPARKITAAAVFTLLASTTPTIAGAIQPEMIIHFKEGTVACLSRDSLHKIMDYGALGEETKMRAMMADKEGDCAMIPPTMRVKVLSAEYNDPNMPDMGLLEIVGADKTKLNGAWALSVGAEEIAPAIAKPGKK